MLVAHKCPQCGRKYVSHSSQEELCRRCEDKNQTEEQVRRFLRSLASLQRYVDCPICGHGNKRNRHHEPLECEKCGCVFSGIRSYRRCIDPGSDKGCEFRMGSYDKKFPRFPRNCPKCGREVPRERGVRRFLYHTFWDLVNGFSGKSRKQIE